MICKHCGNENPDNAAYCISCGKRIDGKIICSNCSNENPDNAIYCMHCGHRIDGKLVCSKCGTVCDTGTSFCYSCGQEFNNSNGSVINKMQQTTVAESGNRKIFNWLSISCFLILALCSLIFIFFVGYKIDINAIGADCSIFYYFYDVFKEAADILKTYPKDNAFLALSMYLPAIIGTILTVGSLVSIVVCTILTALRFFRKVYNLKGNNNFVSPAIGAYFVYLIAICTLYSINYIKLNGSGYNFGVSLNTVTIIGIVFGALFLILGIVLNFISKGKEAFTSVNFISKIILIIMTVFSVLAFCFTTAGAITMSGQGTYLMTTQSYYMQQVGLLYINNIELSAPIGPTITFIISQLSEIVAIILSAIILINLICNLTDEKKSLIGTAISLVIFSLIYLITTIIFGNVALVDTLNTPSSVTISYPMPIVAFIFSVLILILVIVDLVLKYRSKNIKKY